MGSRHSVFGVAQRRLLVVGEDDDAEVRYRKARQRHRQRLTYDRVKIKTVLFLKKNKSLHSVLKNWWRFKRITSMSREQQKQTFLTMAVVSHFLCNYTNRGAKLNKGLAKVMALVFVPFMAPPLVVLGIPSLVLFLPILIFIWAILTLNRSAKKVLLQNRKPKKIPNNSFGKRLSRMLSFSSLGLTSSNSSLTSIRSDKTIHPATINYTEYRRQVMEEYHERTRLEDEIQQIEDKIRKEEEDDKNLRRNTTAESASTNATIATATDTTGVTSNSVASATEVSDVTMPTIVEGSPAIRASRITTGNQKKTLLRNTSWNLGSSRKSWTSSMTKRKTRSLDRRPSQ
ncbi:expressed unknown protein [Seminavis robusta]|uniref:Uncharacterized protein n=1 Tax=Seminavis robusta TaxID=568900 RepID=A0A9N8H247_9STRA|nr:expressed unknown protein [Seminavis robusta]|eukprot:Sro3_g002910.1 n/a (343) ;mRNA; r:274894-275922